MRTSKQAYVVYIFLALVLLFQSILFSPQLVKASSISAVASPGSSSQIISTLLSATFDTSVSGFSYADDTFGTSQPDYASGTYISSGAYSGGGLKVTLGGIDGKQIKGMSGGWQYTFNLATGESGGMLSYRYRLDQSAPYVFDEYSCVYLRVDGSQYGRGAKPYVDYVNGDGSSSQGNSSTYLPTTGWQQHQVYLGDLTAGNHSIVIGAYNNKKDAADETTTLLIDDVVVTSGNSVPASTGAERLVERASQSSFKSYLKGVAQFNDRCRLPGYPSTDYMNALTWVEAQLTAMGYSPVRQSFNYNGHTGTNLFATKVGSVTPTQMYIISAHLDGRGGGDAFDDDGSGVALVLEAARVLAGSDVFTDKSVRFLFFDMEEAGLYGSYGYVQDRRSLQGATNEPTWLGLIQHDMILYDHGAGTAGASQSPFADLDVEWHAGTTKATDSMNLALQWRFSSGLYATDYPANAYNYSTNTDDTAFWPYVASVSVRENRRSLTSGTNAEWVNPYYHKSTDIETSYTDADIRLGYNAVQTTLGFVAELAGATIGSLPINHAPVADPQSVTTAEDTAKGITLTGSDVDGNTLSYSIGTGPSHGSLSGMAPSVTYTPATNYNGLDSFTFRVYDGQVYSSYATVNITVTAVNDAPVANPQSVTINANTAKTITLTATDVDGDALTYSIVDYPANGKLSGTPPNVTYRPNNNYTGGDSFTFRANDGKLDSNVATVSVSVVAVPPSSSNLALNKTATADSEQTSSGNNASKGNDGSTTTRWSANDGKTNHWWKVDLGASYTLTGTKVMFQYARNYRYKIEVSTDNINWTTVVDRTTTTSTAQTRQDSFSAVSGRYVRITYTGLPRYPTTWASHYEFEVYGY